MELLYNLAKLAPIVTACFAGYALLSWKKQKRYELKMELLATARRAADLVTRLRSPLSYEGEIKPEMLAKHNLIEAELTGELKASLVFQSRLDNEKDTYKAVLLLREKAWANYPETHIFYRLYDFIAVTINEIHSAHNNLVMLSDYKTFNDPIFKTERSDFRKKIYKLGEDDVNTKLDKLMSEIVLHRAKMHSIKAIFKNPSQ